MWMKWFSKKHTLKQNDYNDIDPTRLPRHVAIIMDGNGRWAQKKGLPRTLGHRAGAETLREIVKTASEIGIQVLTAYAFSTENWRRPADEVSLLMSLLSDYLDNELAELDENNVQVRFIGHTGDLALNLQKKVEKAQTLTAHNTGLILNLAVNYGGRAELTRAVKIISEKVLRRELDPEDINETIIEEHLYTANLPAPDLLIRPSGDFRISNFLLWQMAYTEFWFTEIHWPDFKSEDLLQAVRDYQQRDRRFGGIKNTNKR
ncbi:MULTISPECIES: isoprenyl transferase [Sporomusa]|uniref:Isoprenyl transferase n=1 Tax=Sporomusa sphaeroides DSM 2875 TaxID=1337886 RepID=A0ABP2C2M5_9FIRM|nr:MULTISPECIES: isoprenyl transferase [Sporomusa]MCM0760157.1 isoprenyl transferase [Sporomusa sphaeroides DSM 2875]OLS58194.1 ditrans,polycis-undecaprenyl-diphosphate synthase ((2E,6E)-farnesyl-diphosphate specific) [Sporomusa sphaeroides DSM 2875]CVK17619.1 Ditrans,polycis-undecaprenyl-diphosphate synthase ((2E,6E)-farnesyl-diphosphate specific) [Sporomusa sphaeroides DSM 2875]HML31527.1 isoprenyl transferase [Sporomusa sphaeroides]